MKDRCVEKIFCKYEHEENGDILAILCKYGSARLNECLC